MEAGRISYHSSVRTAYDRIKKDGMTNIWDRYEAQGLGSSPDQRCPFARRAGAATSVPTAPAAPTPPRISAASAVSRPTVWPCA